MGLRKKFGTNYNFGSKSTNGAKYLMKNNKVIRKVAQEVFNNSTETKEKRYDYTAVGIDPVGGGALSYASVSFGTGTIIAQLCRGITQGTSDSTRIGDQITLKGVYINMPVQCASGTEANYFRMALIRPKGQYTNTSVSALAQQIFMGTASSSTQWASPIDTDYFHIYWDKKVFIKPTDITAVGSPSNMFFTKFIKFGNKYKKGLKIQWDQQNAQPARDLFLVAISDSSLVSHPGAIAGFVRLYFKDG